MPYQITKEFSFCYGHRVWSQELDHGLSEGMPCKCRHLHGHEALVKVHLSAPKLVRGMVTDFNNLAWFKTWLDKYLDHKMILDELDPFLHYLLPMKRSNQTWEYETTPEGMKLPVHIAAASTPTNQKYTTEIGEGIVIVPFVPTSENLAKWIYDVIVAKMPGINVAGVTFHETPKSCAEYFPDYIPPNPNDNG